MTRRLLLALLLLGGPVPGSARGESADVLVVETEHLGPYRLARESFEAAIPSRYRVQLLRVDPDDAEAHRQTVRESGARVLLTLGSRATSWALENTREIPLVFAMVLHPAQSGFIRSFQAPGGRVTGAALDVPPVRHLEVLRDTLGARRIAVLHDPARSGALLEAARTEATALGMEIIAIPVPALGALGPALERVDSTIDALWAVPDPTVFGRDGAKRVLLHTLDHQIPFMGLSEHYVRAGALLAVAASYEENGEQAAERVLRVLDGERPGQIPVSRPQAIEVVFNPNTASRIGLAVRFPTGLSLRPLE